MCVCVHARVRACGCMRACVCIVCFAICVYGVWGSDRPAPWPPPPHPNLPFKLSIKCLRGLHQVFNSAFWIISFLPSLVTPIIAKTAASGTREQVQEKVGDAIFVSALIGTIGMALMLAFPHHALSVVGAEAGVMEAALPYLMVRAITFVPATVAMVCFATFRGTMDIVTPLKVCLCAFCPSPQALAHLHHYVACVWCVVVWRGVMMCDVVCWCGVWCVVVWYGVLWCGMVWCAEGAVTKRQWLGWSCTRENAAREGCVSRRALCVVCCAPAAEGRHPFWCRAATIPRMPCRSA